MFISDKDFDDVVQAIKTSGNSLSKGTINRFAGFLQERMTEISEGKSKQYDHPDQLKERTSEWNGLKTRIDNEIVSSKKLSRLKNKVVVGVSFLFKEKITERIGRYQEMKAQYDEHVRETKKLLEEQKWKETHTTGGEVEGQPVSRKKNGEKKKIVFSETAYINKPKKSDEIHDKIVSFSNELNKFLSHDKRFYSDSRDLDRLESYEVDLEVIKTLLDRPETTEESKTYYKKQIANVEAKIKELNEEIASSFDNHINALLDIAEQAFKQKDVSPAVYFVAEAPKHLRHNEPTTEDYANVRRQLNFEESPWVNVDMPAQKYVQKLDAITKHAIYLAEEKLK